MIIVGATSEGQEKRRQDSERQSRAGVLAGRATAARGRPRRPGALPGARASEASAVLQETDHPADHQRGKFTHHERSRETVDEEGSKSFVLEVYR